MTDRLEEIKDYYHESYEEYGPEAQWLVEAVEGLRLIIEDYALFRTQKIKNAVEKGWLK